MPAPLWQPGQSGNPNGKPRGARHKREVKIYEEALARGDKDSYLIVSDIATRDPDTDRRLTAAVALLPYQHSKNAPRPNPQFIDEPIDLPSPTNIEEAYGNIAVIHGHYASGRLSGIEADRLVSLNKTYIEGRATAQKVALAELENGTGDQIIRIEGGLPELPGTNITMPDLTPALPAPAEEALTTGEFTSQSTSAVEDA